MMLPTYFPAVRTARRWAIGLVLGMAPVALPGLLFAPRTLGAQSVGDFVSAGDRESIARRPSSALGNYERAIKVEPGSYVALWKAAREAVDLGEFEKNAETRTTLYARATAYARRAVAANATDAEGHFQLARAVGRTAQAANPRERVKYALEVRDEALKALELHPKHPGALHVLGVWNAEVMRLNGFSRAIAKTFLGGQVLGSASWDSAIRYMEGSVAADPNRLVHYLDLARVYRDAGRRNEARVAFEAALRAPLQDANDDQYRKSAEEELAKLR